MTEYYNMNILSTLKNINRIKVGIDREPLLVHIKACIGCPDCLPYMPLIKARKRWLDDSEVVDGITRGQALKLRQTHSIYYYYPRGDEFRKPDGELDINVYLKLKNVDGTDGKGFTDAQIWDYFSINQGESQRFKKEHFKEWIGGKDKYIEGDGSLAAIEDYEKKFNKHKTTRVKYHG